MYEMLTYYVLIVAKFVSVASIIITLSALVVISFAIVSFLVNRITNVYANRIWKRLKSTQSIREAVRLLNYMNRHKIRLTEQEMDMIIEVIEKKRKGNRDGED